MGKAGNPSGRGLPGKTMGKWLRIKILRLLQLNVSYAIGADKVSCLNNSAVKESKKSK